MKEKFRHILQVLTPTERRQFWIQIVFNVFISVADIASLAFLLLIIDFYINNSVHRLDFLPLWMLDPGSVSLIAFFFVLFGVKNLLGILISSAQYKFIGRVAVRISQNRLENYQKGTFDGFINIDSSAHIRNIALSPFEFCQYILSGIQQILIQTILILVTITAILLYNAKLFLLILLILLPPVTFVFFYIKKKLTATKKSIQASNEKSFQYLLDALKGYVEGNIYQRNNFFHGRFSKIRQIFSRHLFESIFVQTIPNRIIETFAVLGLFVLIVIAKWSDINDSSTILTIGAFMAAAYKIIPGIVKIVNATGQMRAYDFSINELDTLTSIVKSDDQGKQSELIHTIEVRNLNFQYADNNVIRDFSLSIKKGDFIGITGKSGKGKTTIFNLLLGFLSPSNGGILINNSFVSVKEIKNYWPQISYVRQQSFFIHDTILRNITLEEESYDKERLDSALSISGLCDFIKGSADGLNKMITENGKNISGGQQQRIAIARALYKNAEIILLDEPFNELDEASTVLLAQHFKQIAVKGRAIIMITHDTKCLSYCNKIISLDE